MASVPVAAPPPYGTRSGGRTSDGPRPSVLDNAAKKAEEEAIKEAIALYDEHKKSKPANQQATRNFVGGMLQRLGIKRNKFYYQMSKRDKEHPQSSDSKNENPGITPKDASSVSIPSVGTTDRGVEKKKRARRKKAINQEKQERKEKKKKAYDWATEEAIRYSKDPTKFDEKGHWKRGVLAQLAMEAQEKFNVHEWDEINADTIRQRFNRGKAAPSKNVSKKRKAQDSKKKSNKKARIPKPFKLDNNSLETYLKSLEKDKDSCVQFVRDFGSAVKMKKIKIQSMTEDELAAAPGCFKEFMLDKEGSKQQVDAETNRDTLHDLRDGEGHPTTVSTFTYDSSP